MAERLAVVVAGHVCVDIIPGIGQAGAEGFIASLRPGRLLEVGPAAISGGGAVANTGRALQILGVPTVLMGKVGDDPFGHVLRAVLRADEGMIVDPTTQTSYTLVLAPPGIDRIFLHCPGANDNFSAADIRYDLIAEARLFHFGYPPIMKLMYADGGVQLTDILRRARETGATTSLDLALPDPGSPAGRADWPQILGRALRYVDIFLPSLEEVLFMLRRDTFEALHRAAPDGDVLPLVTPELLSDFASQLLGMGPKVVGLKLGHRGFYLRTAGAEALANMGRACPADPGQWASRELWAPVFQAEVVTAAGAGDSAIAGFFTGLLHGLSAEEALIAAVAAGACNVEAADTTSGLLTWEATRQRVEAGWPQRSLDLESPGWHYDRAARVWRKA